MKKLTKTILGSALLVGSIAISNAQVLDIDVMERADDGLDTCAYGQVAGLKENGDGFLSVRRGPAVSHESFDQLKNNDKVWLFEEKDGWYGIVYGVDDHNCSPIDKDRPVDTIGKKGWVYGKWIEPLAG
ncbi:SH3 domain-containing protein [Lentilitoribacter sp. EG35]|uniref:SH3 domain-containing protein n=1 Tax=Lentilitoribacter sp. EG35 TaxID=3234192 RepID=UPI00346002BD